jgi:hypothetical protein
MDPDIAIAEHTYESDIDILMFVHLVVVRRTRH